MEKSAPVIALMVICLIILVLGWVVAVGMLCDIFINDLCNCTRKKTEETEGVKRRRRKMETGKKNEEESEGRYEEERRIRETKKEPAEG